MFFNYDCLEFRYEPFPVGLAKKLFDETVYHQLVDSYPPVNLFKSLPKFGNKYSLSEKYYPAKYRSYIKSHAIWRELHTWIKSDAFINEILSILVEHNIDLGFGVKRPSALELFMKNLKGLAVGRLSRRNALLRTRFEYSMLPAAGGLVLPHVDNPDKVVTIVASMVKEGEWHLEYGGGTDINRAKNARFKFNRVNKQADFNDMEIVDTYEFFPNQAVIFTPTFNSWHSVRPLNCQDKQLMRRTITIVIESSMF